MPALCPVCGRNMCDHTPAERRQLNEEMMRNPTPGEVATFRSGNDDEKLRVGQMMAHLPLDVTFGEKPFGASGICVVQAVGCFRSPTQAATCDDVSVSCCLNPGCELQAAVNAHNAAHRNDAPRHVGYRYIKYRLTGEGSILTPGIVWPTLVQLEGIVNRLEVGRDHQEVYFVVKPDSYEQVLAVLQKFGEASEISKEEFRHKLPPMP